jgi:hypothetical protein
MKWDRNDWQGRSEENIKFSYKVTAIALLGLIAALLISGIYSLITSL